MTEAVELNSHGVNKNIKYTILSDEKMRAIGFHKNYYEGTDHEEYSPYWYFMRDIEFPEEYKHTEVTFLVQIPKYNSDLNIIVLDDDFCQCYDYQYVLSNNPDHKVANIVREQVERWMKYLQDNRVISGHTYGEYI